MVWYVAESSRGDSPRRHSVRVQSKVSNNGGTHLVHPESLHGRFSLRLDGGDGFCVSGHLIILPYLITTG